MGISRWVCVAGFVVKSHVKKQPLDVKDGFRSCLNRLFRCMYAHTYTRWWFQISYIFFYFHPYLGRWSNLTNIFQMGWNHQYIYTYIWVNWCYLHPTCRGYKNLHFFSHGRGPTWPGMASIADPRWAWRITPQELIQGIQFMRWWSFGVIGYQMGGIDLPWQDPLTWLAGIFDPDWRDVYHVYPIKDGGYIRLLC